MGCGGSSSKTYEVQIGVNNDAKIGGSTTAPPEEPMTARSSDTPKSVDARQSPQAKETSEALSPEARQSPQAKETSVVHNRKNLHASKSLPTPDSVQSACNLKPGVKVILVRLATQELNMTRGICEQWDPEKERWHVKLNNGETKAFKACNLRTFEIEGLGDQSHLSQVSTPQVPQSSPAMPAADAEKEQPSNRRNFHKMQSAPASRQDVDLDMKPGARVRISNLQTAALNGEIGMIEIWDPVKERWNVRLSNGDVKSFKVANLTLMDSQAGGTESWNRVETKPSKNTGSSTGWERKGKEIVFQDDEVMRYKHLKTGKRLPNVATEERGVTIKQLKALYNFMKHHCVAEGWKDWKNIFLKPETMTLYDVCDYVVRPMTKTESTSYFEVIADSPQRPLWFVSHWWGDKFADMISCLEQHSLDRQLGPDAVYWICAFANNQHELDSENLTDMSKCPFRRALDVSVGTLSILGEKPEGKDTAGCYSRAWCEFEVWLSLSRSNKEFNNDENRPLYDVYTALHGDLERRAVGITSGVAPVDKDPMGLLDLERKNLRENHFPLERALGALRVRLQDAEASQDDDRKRILNTIVGVTNLDLQPPAYHPKYEELNCLLRGCFAASTWRAALRNKLPLEEYADALSQSGVVNLEFSFFGAEYFTSEELRRLAKALPDTLLTLSVDLTFTPIDTESVMVFAENLPKRLKTLKVDLSGCKGVSASAISFLEASLKDVLPRLKTQDIISDAIGPSNPVRALHNNLLGNGKGTTDFNSTTSSLITKCSLRNLNHSASIGSAHNSTTRSSQKQSSNQDDDLKGRTSQQTAKEVQKQGRATTATLKLAE